MSAEIGGLNILLIGIALYISEIMRINQFLTMFSNGPL